jgi:hypothetical protein
MLRRFLLALALCSLLPPLPAAAQVDPSPAAGNARVYYRAPGDATWHLHGTYPPEAARSALARLRKQGYEAQSAPVTLASARSAGSAVPTVTPAQAHAAFQALAAREDIAYRFPADGCYARCHMMIAQLLQMGYRPIKVWAFAVGEDLYVRTPNHPRGHVTWTYHVAPVLRVETAEGLRWYALDPALFSGPAPLAAWEGALRRSPTGPRPHITLTRLGEAPVRPKEGRAAGTGYWPAEDPKEGLDAHALSAMRKFKPYEGRLPPAGWPGGDETASARPVPLSPPPPPPPRERRRGLLGLWRR